MAGKRLRLKSVIDAPKRAMVHDRRAIDLPAHADIGAINIQDPYAIPETIAKNERGEWHVEDREQLTVIQSFKLDPIGKMLARHQIKPAEYDAARALQALHDDAQIGVIRAIDPAKEVVDGGQLADALTDKQQSAMRRIRSVERAVSSRHGSNGISAINGVLVDKLTIEQVADREGADSLEKLRYWRNLFRDCLNSLGREMGTIRDERPVMAQDVVGGLTYRAPYGR